MKVFVFRGVLIATGVVLSYFIVTDQRKTRFLIDNYTSIENLNITVSTSEASVFEGTVTRNPSRRRYSKKTKIRLESSDIIHLKVELPDYSFYREAYIPAKGADYISIRVYHSSESLNSYEISMNSFSIDDAREYRTPGL